VQKLIIALRKTMVRAHKQAWTWQDEWVDLTMADIRQLERETQEYLKRRMADDNNDSSESSDILQPKINTSPSGQEIDLNVIDKDNEINEDIIAMEVPKSKNSSSHQSISSKQSSRDQEVFGDGRRKLWSRSNSKAGLHSAGMSLFIFIFIHYFFGRIRH
jgi:hypothetical protein